MTGLEVAGVSAAYGRTRVLESASLRVEPGEVVGLVGRNGAGKSTLLRVISGLLPRGGGTIELGGRPLPGSPPRVARRGVIHVPEGRGLFTSLTVAENLRIGAAGVRRGGGGALDEVLDAIPRISSLLTRRAGSLSGGEQQLVAIGRAFAGQPSMLLVDEASLGLSPRAACEVYDLLRAAAVRGVGCLVVDQNVPAVQRLSSRVYVLSSGRTRLVEDKVVLAADLYA